MLPNNQNVGEEFILVSYRHNFDNLLLFSIMPIRIKMFPQNIIWVDQWYINVLTVPKIIDYTIQDSISYMVWEGDTLNY